MVELDGTLPLAASARAAVSLNLGSLDSWSMFGVERLVEEQRFDEKTFIHVSLLLNCNLVTLLAFEIPITDNMMLSLIVFSTYF